MHVAIIMDQERLMQEQSMLNRLCIGMMAEGVRVTRIVPEGAWPEVLLSGERRMGLATRIEVPMRVLPWLKRWRVERLAAALERHVPDVIYAVGQQAWAVALDLGREMERPVLIDVWSFQSAAKAPRPHRASCIGGYVACSGALAREVGRDVGTELVSMVPMGVPVPPLTKTSRRAAGGPLSVAILGRCRDARAYGELFAALTEMTSEGMDLQIVLELQGVREHEVWRRAKRHELLAHISPISEAMNYRALLTGCDLLLLPEQTGEVRSIILEAMAFGVVAIGQPDAALDMLLDGETAILVDQGDQPWSRVLRRYVAEPDLIELYGRRARRIIESHHRSSIQVSRLIETMERVRSGGALLFKGRAEA
jgi:hypothetical protein